MNLIDNISEYRFILENRFKSCVARYKGIEEYMEIPDMDMWLKLKEEILHNTIIKNRNEVYIEYDSEYDYEYESESDYDNYSMDSIDRKEARINSDVDKLLCSRRFDRYDD
uniref:Uncharacterized protein n=1 Tax=viral metagenome TaxID=1070528 RepID=A0A6C0IDE3_9ZZZZ